MVRFTLDNIILVLRIHIIYFNFKSQRRIYLINKLLYTYLIKTLLTFNYNT